MSKQQKQAGFTLVELAIVMIIIGLLIAGVLKGQQLIGNARITSQVAQIKGIDGAVSTFRDMYNSLPGDMGPAATNNPANRLPNCTVAPCSTPGTGNGIIGNTPSAAPSAEGQTFFVHLAAADLLTGINYSAANLTWGGQFPAAKIDGGIQVGSATGALADVGPNPLSVAANPPSAGLYLTLTLTPNVAPVDVMTPNQAARIDAKVDDGIPGAGSVRARSTAGATCGTNLAYAENNPGNNCGLHIRIQG